MTPKTLFFLLSIAILTSLSACRHAYPQAEEGEETNLSAVDGRANLVLQVTRTSRLYTAEYKIHKIVTHEDVRQVKATLLGHQVAAPITLGDRKVAIPIDVTLKAYIDFSNFSERNLEVTDDGRHIFVTLPDPKVIVTSSKVDHAGTKQFIDLLRSDYSDKELAEYTRQGVEAVVRTVPRLGILETARESAASTLIPLIASLGYEEQNIVINFRKNFTDADMGTIIEK